ncbi:MAG: hypothetical protein RIS35_3467 [Pseudomonadota bacterium]
MSRQLRVWDLPTRVFHWALAACIAGSLLTIQLGGNAVGWHFRFGYAILALLLFRLAWGIVGPRHARFTSFPPDPAAAWRQLSETRPHAAPGHSPLGALSVYAMLLAVALQVTTGLFASDAIMWDGPLKNFVSNDTSDLLTRIHKVNRIVLIGLVALHLAAIAFYRLRGRRGLVAAMITGDARCEAEAGPARDDLRVRAGALLLAAACAGLAGGIVSLGARAGSGF